MKKKIILSVLLFCIPLFSIFARNPFSVSLGGNINYNYIDKMNFGVDLDLKKSYFDFTFDFQTDMAFKNMNFSVFFGGNPYFNNNFTLETLLGIDTILSYKPFCNNVSLSPLFRLGCSYTFDFGLELKPFFDIGYKFNVKNNADCYGFNFKFGLIIAYSFNLGKPDNKIVLHPELDKAYTTILPIDYKTEDKEKSIQNVIDDLEKEKEYYKNLALTENIRYVAVDKNTLLQTEEKAEDVIKSNIENSRESIKSNANFVGSTSFYVYDENKIFDIFLSPKNITDIRLEEGESLVENGIVLGDKNSWICDIISSSENNKNYLHLLFRPQNTNLTTDCMIFTNKRVYKLRLISDSNNFSQVSIKFKYANESNFNLGSSNSNNNSKIYLSTENLNFNYSITGSDIIKPERVYSDTNKTYIQFKNSFLNSSITPTLLMKNRRNEETEIIPFIVKGITYIVPFIIDEEYSFILKLEDKEVEITRSY